MDKRELLKEYFGYTEFKYPQGEIIDDVLSGKDVIALLPTGFGKSVIFQICALMLDGVTIVVCPLISLMEDQERNLKKHGMKVGILNSTMDMAEQDAILKKVISGKIKILYLSPERLQNEYFKQRIKKACVGLIVLDEAHTILWGEGFRSAFIKIADFIDLLPIRPKLLALTATATQKTIQKMTHYLKMIQPKVIGVGVDRPNLFFRVEKTNDKFRFLKDYIRSHFSEKGIVYCITRRKVEELSKKLAQIGISSACYHGGLELNFKQLQQQYFTTGDRKLMICTNAFGMGIDISDIRYVILYEIPASLEDLIQQVGRAARDGGFAEGIVLFSFADIRIHEYFRNTSLKSVRKDQLKKLDRVVDYCLSKKCRHQMLAAYFNQKINKCYSYCDNCSKVRIK